MREFLLTTNLLFDDGSREGQVFHRGTESECLETARLINAISYSGTKRVTESCFLTIPMDSGFSDLAVGECWHTNLEATR